MHPFLQKTLGGLSAQYYFRQLVFGVGLAALFIFLASQGGHSPSFGQLAFALVSTLLYPYSRFVYESVVGFIMGNNLFLVNALVMLTVKFVTMLMCWAFALFVAPLGLVYLYVHHSRQAG